MKEKRKYSRKPLAVSLELCGLNSHEIMGRGFITNLSEGGMALETHKYLYLGEKLKLRFSLTNGNNFDLVGEIKYYNDGILSKAYGVEFDLLNGDCDDRLKRYLVTIV